MQDLYEEDEHLWKLQSAQQMRKLASVQIFDEYRKLFQESANYLEEMAKSDQRALEGYTKVVLLHLLKKDYQPEKEGNSWIKSINNSRRKMEKLLRDLPSLKNKIKNIIDSAYKDARKEASEETLLELATFPKKCPYNPDQILDDKFFGEFQ